jgi:hypothetical protein
LTAVIVTVKTKCLVPDLDRRDPLLNSFGIPRRVKPRIEDKHAIDELVWKVVLIIEVS